MNKFAQLTDSELRSQIAKLEEELEKERQRNRTVSADIILASRLLLLELRVEWLERQ